MHRHLVVRDRPVVGRDWLIEVGIPVLDLVEKRRRLGDRFLLRDRCVLGGATGEFNGCPFGHRSGRCRFDGGGRDPFRLGVRCGDRFRGTDSLLCDLVVESAAALVDQRCRSQAQLPERAVDVDGVGSRFGVDRVLHRPAQLQRQRGDARHAATIAWRRSWGPRRSSDVRPGFSLLIGRRTGTAVRIGQDPIDLGLRIASHRARSSRRVGVRSRRVSRRTWPARRGAALWPRRRAEQFARC